MARPRKPSLPSVGAAQKPAKDWPHHLPPIDFDTPSSLMAYGNGNILRFHKDVEGIEHAVTYRTVLVQPQKSPHSVRNMPLRAALERFVRLYWIYIAPEVAP